MTRSIAGKIFLGFCVVLLVVLALGLWSLQATRRLHGLNEALLQRAIPAVRLQLVLEEQIPNLRRHEARAVVLRDPAYQTLHRQAIQAFRSGVHGLSTLVDTPEILLALDRVQTALVRYAELVEEQWRLMGKGAVEDATLMSKGATRQATDQLSGAVDALLDASRDDLARKVQAASGVESAARVAALLGIGTSLAIGLGIASMVALRIARPIRDLGLATRRVAAGDYDIPVVTDSRDEVGELARAFRDMSQRLREVEELKQQLLSNISHDFRSPLTSIQMAAQLIGTEPLNPKQERWRRIISSDSVKLLRLTNQILDLSKVRFGTLQLALAPASARDIVESAVEELRPVADERGIALSAEVPDGLDPIVCDNERIQQVLTNLLANAVKFTPRGGDVRVRASLPNGGREFVMAVEDNGVGIPSHHLPHIFDRYHQAHVGKGGTGLGLAIVKGFVEAHHGRVWVESEEGRGTRFFVALPREPGSPA